MQEVAVVQSLQTEVVKLQIAIGFEGCAQSWQVELHQFFVEQAVVYALLDVAGEVVKIVSGHVFQEHFFAQDFFGNGVHQEARSGVRVVRVFFDQGARRQDRRLVNLFHGHAVIEVAHGFRHDGVGMHVFAQALASIDDEAL